MVLYVQFIVFCVCTEGEPHGVTKGSSLVKSNPAKLIR